MKDAANFAKYAEVIYSRLNKMVADEFMMGRETTHFRREAKNLFLHDFRLAGIGCEHTSLCHASFDNGIVATPYAILRDEEMKRIVITMRGTLSLDDMVVDLQYNPASLEKTGVVCGFQGDGHYCHKGCLTRAKWLYNDIKK